MNNDKMMTVNEVAEWMKVTPQTIRQQIKLRKLIAIPVGGEKKPRYRIPFQNVLEWQRQAIETKK